MHTPSRRRLSRAELFGVANLSAWVASVAGILVVGLYRHPGAALTALVFNLVAFSLVLVVACSALWVIRPVTAAAGPWLVLPALGGCLGLFVAYAGGLLLALFPLSGLVGGFAGGLAAAWFWGYSEDHPGALDFTVKSRMKFTKRSFWLLAGGAILVGIALLETAWTR